MKKKVSILNFKMKKKVSILNFRFEQDGDDNFYITYTSPKGKFWTAKVSEEQIIDARANFTQESLNELMRYCKKNPIIKGTYIY